MSEISKNIKRIRTAKGINQTELAEKIGVPRQTVSSWEKGVSFPNIEMLEKMSTVFDLPIDELLYLQSHKVRKHSVTNPLTFKFVIVSVITYFVLLIWGGGLIAIPLFKRLVGGGVNEEFVYIVYWGLILLVGYIAVFALLMSDYMSYCVDNLFAGCCDNTQDMKTASINETESY